jgi:hypothetical protein
VRRKGGKEEGRNGKIENKIFSLPPFSFPSFSLPPFLPPTWQDKKKYQRI